MKNRIVTTLIITCVFVSATSFSVGPNPDALNSITPEDIRHHIDFLASDSLMGRDTPSAGLNIAADYIAGEFQKYGVLPLNGDTYFQRFYLSQKRLGKENQLQLRDGSGSTISFELKKDFVPFDFSATEGIKGALVFAGYGITAPEYGYDDYADLDVKGKIVLVLRHEPGENDPNSIFAGLRTTRHALFRSKAVNASEHGAIGLLIVTDPVNHRSLRPHGYPWPSLYPQVQQRVHSLRLSTEEEAIIPALHVGRRFIHHVFGSIDSLTALQRRIDATFTPQSFAIPGDEISMKTTITSEFLTAQNVVGFWEGSDPQLRDEVIVIGAHYDHVGFLRGEFQEGEDYIFNGADDNASGTVGLLEIAQAFSFSARPKRSLVFIAFAAEEKGLLGSKAYVREPLWPLAKTKAMLNMDMIGRNRPNHVSIIGYSHSPDLNQINIEENAYIGLKLDYDGERFFMRSDQYNFARNGIPVLFYNTGDHRDYHKVTDNPDKINERKIARIASLVFRTAWRAANTDKSFRYVEP